MADRLSSPVKFPVSRSQDNPARSRPGTGAGVAGRFVRILLPLALIAGGWFGFSKLSVEPDESKAEEKEKQSIKTRVAEMTIEDFKTVITTQGTVRAHDDVPLSAQVPGEIVRIHPGFETGAFFNEGEVLVELDAADYESMVAVAEAELVRAEVALSQEEVRAEQAVLNWKKLGKEGEPAELVKRLPQLKEARALTGAMTAQLARAKRDLERTRIRAPYDGRVRERSVGLGQSVAAGSPLGTVFAVDYAEVRLPLSGRDLSLLDLPEEAGDPTIAVELSNAMNLDDPTTWKAEIVRTEGALDPDSLELFAIAKISDPFGRQSGAPPLRVGQPVVARIEGKVLADVIALPRRAVYQLDQVCLVDKAELTLKPHTITALWSTPTHVIIRDSKIDPARDLLALTSLVYAPDGAKVEIIPSLGVQSDGAVPGEAEDEDEGPAPEAETKPDAGAEKADDTSS